MGKHIFICLVLHLSISFLIVLQFQFLSQKNLHKFLEICFQRQKQEIIRAQSFKVIVTTTLLQFMFFQPISELSQDFNDLFVSLTHIISLSLSLTHTHTHIHTHTYTHTLSLSLIHTHTHTLSLSLTLYLSLTRSLCLLLILSLFLCLSRIYSISLSYFLLSLILSFYFLIFFLWINSSFAINELYKKLIINALHTIIFNRSHCHPQFIKIEFYLKGKWKKTNQRQRRRNVR